MTTTPSYYPEDSEAPRDSVAESFDRCRELLTSDTPRGRLTRGIEALTRAVLNKELSCGKQSQCLDDAIACFEDGLKSFPGFHLLAFEHAQLLFVRFLTLQKDEDYKDAKATLDRIPSPREDMISYQITSLSSALGLARSVIYSNPGDWERAVPRCRSFIENFSVFNEPPFHPIISELLADLVERVSEHFTPPQGAQVHLEADHLPFFAPLGTSRDTVDPGIVVVAPSPMELQHQIDTLQDLRSTTPVGTEGYKRCLGDLVRLYHFKIFLTDDRGFIEEAIKCNERLLATTDPTEISKFRHLSNFAKFLYVAFHRTKKAEYLNKSIDLHGEVLGLESARLEHFSIIQRLICCLSTRLRNWRMFDPEQVRHQQELDEVMRLFELGVGGTTERVPARFGLAYRWADAARKSSHSSLQNAYENAISLMQSSLVFGPTLPIQHSRLVENGALYKTPLNFASYLIQKSQLERAIEILEQGRSLLWSEMRGLRTSADLLCAANPLLAGRFTAINQELEILTTSASSNGNIRMDDKRPDNDKWTGQLSDLTKRQHKLLMERDALILQIRGQPGFEKFLLPLSFDTLRSAALHGPVVIINHCQWRSDILIVFHDSAPSHIPTPYDFFDRANRLKDRLEEYGPNLENFESALSSVLMELYELVGRPVIERLKQLGIAEQSRVWWCPTSVFGYLPLHAMGPIPSDNGDLRYFSDVYVSSYTPTLSALIASREPNTQASSPLALLVAQPSPSPPGAWPHAEAIHDLVHVTSLSAGDTTPDTVLDGLQRHQFAYVAHRVELKPGKPFEAAVRFPNGESFTVLDIVRSRYPDGESALLSGPRTAELTKGSIPDEALHLAAAMQFSGFRSVIGTMWGTDDEAWQNLAEAVCKSMFSDKKGGEAYYERSARALQHAVQKMRPGLPLARWVKYVHHGA